MQAEFDKIDLAEKKSPVKIEDDEEDESLLEEEELERHTENYIEYNGERMMFTLELILSACADPKLMGTFL